MRIRKFTAKDYLNLIISIIATGFGFYYIERVHPDFSEIKKVIFFLTYAFPFAIVFSVIISFFKIKG